MLMRTVRINKFPIGLLLSSAGSVPVGRTGGIANWGAIEASGMLKASRDVGIASVKANATDAKVNDQT